jgi:hypothetical protein
LYTHSPVAVFGFNRPKHLRRTLDSLSSNVGAKSSAIFLFIDGPRNDQDIFLIRECVDLSTDFQNRFASFNVYTQDSNQGLARSIITGVSKVLENYSTVIVVEDDLVTSPLFLDFINRALNRYANDQEVASIHGFVTPFKKPLSEPFFMRGADCWGWGTWRDRWELFNPNGQELLDQLESRELLKEFDLDGAYPFSGMLKDQIAGKNNSWAIRWHASIFLQNKLTLYPARTYVVNIGFDGSGTHTGHTSIYESELSLVQQQLPNKIEVSQAGVRELSRWYREVYFGKTRKIKKILINPYLGISNFLKRIVRKIFRMVSIK